MKEQPGQIPIYETLQLGGTTYAVLPEALLQEIARRAKVTIARTPGIAQQPPQPLTEADVDPALLAQRLATRRRQAGLTQAELAKLAELRPETINRIERGRTTPDFKTIRKLVVAMNRSEKNRQSAMLEDS